MWACGRAQLAAIRAGQAQPAAVVRTEPGRPPGRALPAAVGWSTGTRWPTWAVEVEACLVGGPAGAARGDPRRPGAAGGQGPGGAWEAWGEVRAAGSGLVLLDQVQGVGEAATIRKIRIVQAGEARWDPRRPSAAGGRGPGGAREA